jgi:hypothetical protein
VGLRPTFAFGKASCQAAIIERAIMGRNPERARGDRSWVAATLDRAVASSRIVVARRGLGRAERIAFADSRAKLA